MLAQRFANLEADAEYRIERAHRLLEDHRDLGAAQGAQLARRGFEEIFTVVANLPSWGCGCRQQP
jgi:hypothetical protein